MPKVIRTTCSMVTPICADYNTVIEGVPDEVARFLADMGNAVILAGDDPEPEERDLVQQLAEEIEPVLAAGPEPYLTDRDEDPEVAASSEDAEMKRPYGNAAKSAWIRWALHSDPELTQEAAAGMSKVDLMAKYGERL